MNLTEQELVLRCLQQDRNAQRMLYERYCDAMFTLVMRLSSQQEDAEDALQEGFIEVFKHLAQFKGEATLGSWIKKIMIRTALKKVRQYEKTSAKHTEVENVEIEFEFSDTLTGEWIEKNIQSLPERTKAVFILIEVEGYSHEEVAQLLSVSVGTSKSQLHYAKTLLQQQLKSYFSIY